MGANKSKPGVSPAEKAANDKIESALNSSKEKDLELIKLLLLGAGESGKSTLFRQMINLYGEGFSEKDKRLYAPMICSNTIEAMKELVLQSPKMAATMPECKMGADMAESAKYISELKFNSPDRGLAAHAEHVKKLWTDKGIRATFDQRAKFQLIDSASYFFDSIDRLAAKDFLPNEEDLIRCRVRTTGIVESRFCLDGNRFLMVDVGGQRNERKKWIHSFEGVTAVIFVTAISEYDQVLYEDGKTNRMEESLALFGDVANSRWFVDTAIVLFLNKTDLFKVKLAKVPLSTRFKDYKGKTYDEAIAYLTGLFEQQNKSQSKRLYVHPTCATSSHNVRVVFGIVKDIIVQRQLAESGLI